MSFLFPLPIPHHPCGRRTGPWTQAPFPVSWWLRPWIPNADRRLSRSRLFRGLGRDPCELVVCYSTLYAFQGAGSHRDIDFPGIPGCWCWCCLSWLMGWGVLSLHLPLEAQQIAASGVSETFSSSLLASTVQNDEGGWFLSLENLQRWKCFLKLSAWFSPHVFSFQSETSSWRHWKPFPAFYV